MEGQDPLEEAEQKQLEGAEAEEWRAQAPKCHRQGRFWEGAASRFQSTKSHVSHQCTCQKLFSGGRSQMD